MSFYQINQKVTWAMRPSSGLSKDTHNPTGLHFDFSCACRYRRLPGFAPPPRGFSVVPELHSAPKNARGVAFEHDAFRARWTDKSLPVTPATRLSIAVNRRGRSHSRRRLRPRAFGHFSTSYRFLLQFILFYFICIISFSGLHVLGLERTLTLHDLACGAFVA